VLPLGLKLFRRHGRYGSSYLSVTTTRGCPYRCSYCCNHLLSEVNGRQIRRRSAASVLAEIGRNIERYPGRIHYLDLIDDCFMLHSEEWLREFTEGCSAFGIPILFRAIPRYVTEDKARLLARAPAGFALLGIQSGSERTNREIYERPFSRDEILRCAGILDRHRIPAMYDVIVDNPWEGPEDWEATARLLHALPASSHIFFYSLTFYPNTRLFDRAARKGIAVAEHLTKSQDHYEESSPEARWIRLSLHFRPDRVRGLALGPAGDGRVGVGGRLACAALEALTRGVLDPVRLARLAWMSQQGRLTRLGPLFFDFTREFLIKIYSPRRVRGGYEAGESCVARECVESAGDESSLFTEEEEKTR
jgi:hypothetical protein